MYVYHQTDAAEAILVSGFRDGTTHPLNILLGPGVWVSTFPLNGNESATGEAVLRLDMPGALFVDHELLPDGEDDRTYREALIPAALLNQYGPPSLLSEDEVDALEDPRFTGPEDEDV